MHSTEPRKTYRDVIDKQKKEIMEHNTKTFANISVGIHGVELPKFENNIGTREFWKAGNCPNIIHSERSSHVMNNETNKPKLRNPSLEENASINRVHFLKNDKKELPEKIGEIKKFDSNEYKRNINKIKSRQNWTSTVERFMPKVTPNDGVNSTEARKEIEPLYSSFSPNKKFIDNVQTPKT